MSIVYTSKAKEDLISIDWRVREKIIETLSKLNGSNQRANLSRMHNSDYYKLKLQNHLIIGKFNESGFNIITVVEQKRIKFPE